MNLDTGHIGADTDVRGVSDVSVSSDGHSVSEPSVGHNTSVVHVREDPVEGLGPPLAVDVGISSVSVMVDGSDGGVSNNSYIVRSAVGNSAGNVCSGSDLSDGVRLWLGLSVHCSVGEPGYLTETVTVGNSSDNTTSGLAS